MAMLKQRITAHRDNRVQKTQNYNIPIPSIKLQLTNNDDGSSLSSIFFSSQGYVTPDLKKIK